jgi:hypothetical protein
MAKNTTKLSMSDTTALAPDPTTGQTLPALAPKAGPSEAPGVKVSQSQRETFVLSIAERLAKDASLIEELNATVNAKTQTKLGPVHILVHIMSTFGCAIPTAKKPEVWSDESQVLRGWPVAGTQSKGLGLKGKPEVPANAGRWSDYYAKTVFVDGKSEVINGSFFEDLYDKMDAMLEGNSLRNQLKFVRDALLDEPQLADNPFIIQTKAWLKSERHRLIVALSDGADKLRTAMKVYDQIMAINDEFDGTVQILFTTQVYTDPQTKKKEDILARTPAMIVVRDRDRPHIGHSFEIAGFLALDVNKAVNNGGEYQNIIDSGKTTRAPQVPGQRDKVTADALSRFNVSSFFDAMALLGHFFEDDGKVSDLYKELAKVDRNTELMSTGTVAFRLANMFMVTKSVDLTSLGKKWKAATAGDTGEQSDAA